MNNKFKSVYVLGGFIILVVLFIWFIFFAGKNELDIVNSSDVYVKDLTEDNGVDYSGDFEIDEDMIYVHILGAVNLPGVIKIQENSRVYEVIELAGGLLKDADISRINLASIVTDEQKIIVPYKVANQSEPEKINELFENNNSISSNDENFNGLININTASSEMLEKLDGIGASTANKIIRYRNENGRFDKIEDIKNVSGIGESKFNAIKNDITV